MVAWTETNYLWRKINSITAFRTLNHLMCQDELCVSIFCWSNFRTIDTLPQLTPKIYVLMCYKKFRWPKFWYIWSIHWIYWNQIHKTKYWNSNFFLITFDFVIHFQKKTFFPSISYYFHIPKLFLIFFPHTGKNRNRRKSNLLP